MSQPQSQPPKRAVLTEDSPSSGFHKTETSKRIEEREEDRLRKQEKPLQESATGRKQLNG